MADRYWMQVNTATGGILSTRVASTDYSGNPTKPGGTWIEVEIAELELARSGEDPEWVDANPVGTRVSERPFPRLRFTGGNIQPHIFRTTVGGPVRDVTITQVDRNGDPLGSPSAQLRLIISDSTGDYYKRVDFTAGVATLTVQSAARKVVSINNQQAAGYRVEAAFESKVIDTSTDL